MRKPNLSPPLEQVAGAPVITLVGWGTVRIENHRGLVGYAPEEICLNLGRRVLRLRGSGLTLADMSDNEAVITGAVDSLDFPV